MRQGVQSPLEVGAKAPGRQSQALDTALSSHAYWLKLPILQGLTAWSLRRSMMLVTPDRERSRECPTYRRTKVHPVVGGVRPGQVHSGSLRISPKRVIACAIFGHPA